MMKLSFRSAVFGSAALFVSSFALATPITTQTITNAAHFGYFGFASTSANNTKTPVLQMPGTIRVIRAEGTITKVHPDAWVSSIRVQPRNGGLAVYQPWFQFSEVRDFPTNTVNVGATIWIPGGLQMSGAMNFEMFSIDSEEFVPGLDARSTITYTFDDAYPQGTVEYSGRLEQGDPTFNRPIQFPSSAPGGLTQPFLSGQMPFYDVQPFHVDSAGSYSMVSSNEFESAGVLYKDNFNPASPLTNVVRALSQTGNVLRPAALLNNLPFNDDATGGTVITVDLVPGTQYYFVTSAYAAPGSPNDGGPFIGRYNNLIAPAGGGASFVRLGMVPEPSCVGALLAIGALATRRCRSELIPLPVLGERVRVRASHAACH